MRYNPADTAKTRQKIVKGSARLLREEGLAVSVNDLMKTAGLTHGSFYLHFESKEKLTTEALKEISDGMLQDLRNLPNSDSGKLAYFERYLGRTHRDNPGRGCMMAALAPEISRAPRFRKVFTDHLKAMIGQIAEGFPWHNGRPARSEAIVTLSAMVGALVLARASNDVALSEEILDHVKDALGRPATGS